MVVTAPMSGDDPLQNRPDKPVMTSVLPDIPKTHSALITKCH